MSENPQSHGQKPESGQPRYGQRLPAYGENTSHAPQPPTYGTPYGVPQPPAPQQGASAGVPIPRKVQLAFQIMVGAAVAYALSNAWMIFLTATGQLDDQIQEATDMMKEIFGDALAAGLPLDVSQMRQQQVIGNVILAVIGLALFIVVALLIRRGFKAGRIIATVCAVLTVFSLFSFPDMIWWALGLVATIFAWSREATHYCHAASRARAQAKFGQWTGR